MIDDERDYIDRERLKCVIFPLLGSATDGKWEILLRIIVLVRIYKYANARICIHKCATHAINGF